MGNTAIDEQRGGSVDVTLYVSTVYMARLPHGPGGVRLYVVRPMVVGSSFRMPHPDHCNVGADPVCVVVNKGTQPISMTTRGGTFITSLAAGFAVECYLGVVGVDLWYLSGPFVVGSNNALNAFRKPFDIVYTSSSSTVTRVRNDIARQYGYVSADGPVAVNVRIKTNVVLGGGTPTSASFSTGSWPAGSTMAITLEDGAFIAGAGGAGGRGMDAAGNGMTTGGNGGLAMDVRVNTLLINHGTIQGGGGGGAAGSRKLVASVWLPGGSGGGGAGANPGAGGGIVNSMTSTIGQAGSFTAGGAGGTGGAGSNVGGTGGAPGAFGSNILFGSAPGAAGVAITVNASNGYTLNKIVAGTITGAEMTF